MPVPMLNVSDALLSFLALRSRRLLHNRLRRSRGRNTCSQGPAARVAELTLMDGHDAPLLSLKPQCSMVVRSNRSNWSIEEQPERHGDPERRPPLRQRLLVWIVEKLLLLNINSSPPLV